MTPGPDRPLSILAGQGPRAVPCTDNPRAPGGTRWSWTFITRQGLATNRRLNAACSQRNLARSVHPSGAVRAGQLAPREVGNGIGSNIASFT
jgi:hypothetical protein